jgi:hypothetical protein
MYGLSEETFLNTPPTTIKPIGKSGWCFTFGDDSESGVVYLIPGKAPYYLRFKLVYKAGQPKPIYEPMSARDLTPEEVSHFEALVPVRA